MIFKIIKWPFKKVYRKVKSLTKRQAKLLLLTYLTGLFPIGYLNTAITTKLPISEPQKVITKFVKSGPINMLSAGITKPLFNGVKSVTGSTLLQISNVTGNEKLEETGQKLKNDSKKWFNYGNDLFENVKDKTIKIKNKGIEILENSKKDKIKDIDENIVSDDFSDFNVKESPNYYKILGESEINVGDFPKQGEIIYRDLDNLGRTRGAKATITYQMFEKSRGTREIIPSSVKPSGYRKNTEKVEIKHQNGKTYHGYMWNKSHLIADSLGGSPIVTNLVMGTRPQNVGQTDNRGGMAYAETRLREMFKNNKKLVVFYEVTPVYKDDELIPRHCIVRVKSNDGSFDEKIKVYNEVVGYEINYNNGTYKKIDKN